MEILDFSTLQVPGEYRLEIPGMGASDPFKIAGDIWNEPYQVVSRATLASVQAMGIFPAKHAFV